jgi:hypothetical protein
VSESYVWTTAGDAEFARARQLEGISLFAELNLDVDEIERTRDLYGKVLRDYVDRLGFPRLVQRFPALTLTTLIGHAGLDYEQGKYWESFWAGLGVDPQQDRENLLRDKLGVLLRKFKMREFPELRGQYVQVMAVHVGIPVHCLGDLVDVIEAHLAAGREPTGAGVFEWLTQPGLEYRMNHLDAPVRNFLRFGGEVAVDIVDRIIEFADYTREHPDVENDFAIDTETTGLPTLILDALIDRWTDQPFGALAPGAPRVARTRGPALAYSRDDDQVVVEVPYPATAPETPWLVSFDGDIAEVYAERGWAVGEGEAHPLTPVPVPRRVREVVLRHEATQAYHRITVVDKDNPVLLFDLNGRLLSRHSALPRAEVIGIHPVGADLVDAHTGEVVPYTVTVTPVGWRDWEARLYDLAEVDGLQLHRDIAFGPVQQVRRTGAARLHTQDPIAGLYSRSGLPVYADRPVIELPPGDAETVSWQVRVRRAGTVDWLVSKNRESGPAPTPLDPFDGLQPGLLGFYDVAVSGPPGQDLRYSMFMAEGLSIEYGSEFRLPTPSGLTEALAEVTALAPLRADKSTIAFEEKEREVELRVDSGSVGERFVLRPPYVDVRADLLGAAAQWRTAAPVLTLDDLAEHFVLAARVPGSVEVDMVLVDASGEHHQYATPTVNRDNVFQLASREFVDTARKLRTASVVVRIDTPDGRMSEATVARIQPRRLVSAARLQDGALAFDDIADAELAAFVWPDTAPWMTPIRVAISNGCAELPPEFINAGPLTVQVFVDDPWAVITAPPRPDDTSFTVRQPGWMRDLEPDRAALAQFFAGQGDVPRATSALPEVWAVFAASDHTPVSSVIRGGLLQMLRADPRSSVEALDRSAVGKHLIPALLIRSAVIQTDLASPFRSASPANPWLACLVDIADLPLLARYSTDRTVGEEIAADLAVRGGAGLKNLLCGRIEEAYTDIFDQTSVSLHHLPAGQFSELKQACEIVPGALLDGHTRRSGVFDAFEQRLAWQQDPARAELTIASAQLMTQLRRAATGAVRREAAVAAYDAVKFRNEALSGADTTVHPWLLMSMQSLLFAVTARLTAHSVLPGSPITAPMRNAWARLAQLCPGLVSTDVLIAEALVSHALHGTIIDRIGETW